MEVAPNALAIVGAVRVPTISVAVALLPVPPFVEVTAEVVLFLLPAVVPVTLIENVQDPAAARVAPERVTLPLPAVAVMVPPPHEPVRPLGVATERPAGNVSLNATPVSAVEVLELLIVKVSTDVPPTEIDAGAKLLAIEGGDSGFTVSVAPAVLPVPPFVDVTAEVVLLLSPAVAPVTVIEKVQLPPPAMLAPVSVMVFALDARVPPH